MKEEILQQTYKLPDGAINNAKKVLRWKEDHGDEVKGMTSVGWTRARQLAAGGSVSIETVKAMSAFNRHRKNAEVDAKHKGEPWKDAGYVAWLGWGGTTGIDWARRITGALSENQESIHYVSLLSEMSEIEILKVGKIHGRGLEITDSMLDDFIRNFHDGVYGTELQVNLGHDREGEAAGWITDLYRQGDTLMAKVEWTPLGEEKIKSKQFRYTSSELDPERPHFKTGEIIKNVLIGVGLTNIPAVKGMKAVTLSEEVKNIINMEQSMEKLKEMYDELMAQDSISKEDVAAFHEACGDHMGDDSVKEMVVAFNEKAGVEAEGEGDGGATDTDTDKVEEDTAGGADEETAGGAGGAGDDTQALAELEKRGMVALSASELAELRADAKAGREASLKLQRAELSEHVREKYTLSEDRSVGLKKSDENVGQVVDFLMSLSEKQRKAFDAVMAKIVSVDLSERGADIAPSDVSGHSVEQKLSEAKDMAQKIANEKGVEMHVALSEAYEKLGLTA